MDQTAFFKLSYGLYIISSQLEGKQAGCIVNTVTQVTAEPERMTVAVHKENYTAEVIKKSGVFAVSVLTQQADMDLIGKFGFESSKDTDKFAGLTCQTDENGVKYITGPVAARFACKVIDCMDAGTHYIFLADVVEAKVLSSDEVLTYSYYHQVKKGLTPPKASSYQKAEEVKGWRCTICGYVHKSETLPPDFVCPICKRSAEYFEKIV